MLNTCATLIELLLGSIFPSWLSCEPIQLLFSSVIILIIFKAIFRIIK